MEKYCEVGQATGDNITWRMRIACWITQATNTHSEYAIFIAFAMQQWLRERVSTLRHTYSTVQYIACIACITTHLSCLCLKVISSAACNTIVSFKITVRPTDNSQTAESFYRRLSPLCLVSHPRRDDVIGSVSTRGTVTSFQFGRQSATDVASSCDTERSWCTIAVINERSLLPVL